MMFKTWELLWIALRIPRIEVLVTEVCWDYQYFIHQFSRNQSFFLYSMSSYCYLMFKNLYTNWWPQKIKLFGQVQAMEVVGLTYQYVTMILSKGPQEWIFKELQAISVLEFRYAEEGAADEYAMSLASTSSHFSRLILLLTFMTFFWGHMQLTYREFSR